MVISDLSPTSDGQIASVSPADHMMGREGNLVLVNGQYQPDLTARPGQRERWRVINACTSRYLRLELTEQQVELLGIDISQEPTPRPMSDITLAPGNRADLLVTMGADSSTLRSLGYDRVGMGMMRGGDLSDPITLASLTVAGETDSTSTPVPDCPAAVDLRNQPVAAHREIAFSMTIGPMMRSDQAMGFDGRVFDANRIDQQVTAGTVEEWLITNPTPMDYPFHLHVWPMQVIEAQGEPIEEPTWRDVVNVPAQGRVRVLVNFARHPGRSVYHCHILDHEDAGMMATVEVR